jgi:hypothetical protein
MKASYGSAWQEFRALVASVLLGWALRAHLEATLDLTAELERLRR